MIWHLIDFFLLLFYYSCPIFSAFAFFCPSKPYEHICFSCLIAVARTSNTLLNKSGESKHSCLVPDLRGEAFSLCPLSMMLAVSFSHLVFIMLKYATSIPTLLYVFIKNGCWLLSNGLNRYVQNLSSQEAIYIYIYTHTFFSNAHGKFSKIDHKEGHKTSLNIFSNTEII